MLIEITDAEIAGKLEHIAAQDGVSVEQVAVDFIKSGVDQSDAIKDLEAHLQPSIEQAERGEFSPRSVQDIVKDVYQELDAK
ncbi:MAG: hypothetical protein AAGJ81_04205 [Verrucomicrobiota bacterium]